MPILLSLFLAPLVAGAAPRSDFTLPQILGYPYASQLASAEHDDVIAWVRNLGGLRKSKSRDARIGPGESMVAAAVRIRVCTGLLMSCAAKPSSARTTLSVCVSLTLRDSSWIAPSFEWVT